MPELIKKMYDYRMAIENMRAEVTVTHPVNMRQPIRETERQNFFFAFDRGRIRYDKNQYNSKSGLSWLDQSLSTPEFFFHRHPHGVPEVNDGNSLFVNSPLTESLGTLDPRRIGTDLISFDATEFNSFNYDTLLDTFYKAYKARAENYNVSIDYVDGEKLYKVSFQFKDRDLLSTYWISPQKGYNLVRFEAISEMDNYHHSYVVILEKFPAQKGEIWFPRKIVSDYSLKDIVVKQEVVLDSVAFDVQDETPFTLTGLNIPVGYRVEYFSEGARYWNGKELVDRITFVTSDVKNTNRKVFWIVNGIGFGLIALWIFIRWIKLLRRRST